MVLILAQLLRSRRTLARITSWKVISKFVLDKDKETPARALSLRACGVKLNPAHEDCVVPLSGLTMKRRAVPLLHRDVFLINTDGPSKTLVLVVMLPLFPPCFLVHNWSRHDLTQKFLKNITPALLNKNTGPKVSNWEAIHLRHENGHRLPG